MDSIYPQTSAEVISFFTMQLPGPLSLSARLRLELGGGTGRGLRLTAIATSLALQPCHRSLAFDLALDMHWPGPPTASALTQAAARQPPSRRLTACSIVDALCGACSPLPASRAQQALRAWDPDARVAERAGERAALVALVPGALPAAVGRAHLHLVVHADDAGRRGLRAGGVGAPGVGPGLYRVCPGCYLGLAWATPRARSHRTSKSVLRARPRSTVFSMQCSLSAPAILHCKQRAWLARSETCTALGRLVCRALGRLGGRLCALCRWSGVNCGRTAQADFAAQC